MITLSYAEKPINPGIPIYRQPVLHRWHYFSVTADDAVQALPFNQKLMRAFKDYMERRRKVIDIEAYPAAQMGYNFAQGNSHIETETYMGTPTKICLSYAAIENRGRRLSPSRFSESRIAEIAQELRQQAPALVICEPSVNVVIETSLGTRPSFGNQGEIVAFPVIKQRLAL